MCGIFAYTGNKQAAPILLDGLRTLEYRGYDSAGLFIPSAGIFKAVGPVAALADKVPEKVQGMAGIAHTRWATHGLPTEANAHPHGNSASGIWLVHNGIIENYRELRAELEAKGYVFQSDTDTEALVGVIIEEQKTHTDLAHSVTAALLRVRGTYGIAVMSEKEPDTIFVARLGSPIALGIGDGEYVIASDAAPIVRHTKNIIYLNDGECATVSPAGYHIFTRDHAPLSRMPEQVSFDAEEVKKQGYSHFMLKEIMEGPEVLLNSMRGRLLLEEGRVKLGGIADMREKLRGITRLVITGCGSAYYAGLFGKHIIEELAGIPVEVEYASEFRYGAMALPKGSAVLAISQSGETADTLAAIKEAKRKGILTLGIVNVVGSTIARETDAGIYNHAGPEIGVASTKAYLSQLLVLSLLALFLGRDRSLSLAEGKRYGAALQALPEQLRALLERHEELSLIAARYKDARDFLYIGRRFNFGSAYEGALKLKEVSYVHAEGYGAGEMKHGPIAMIDETFPTVAIMPKDSMYEKMRSNVEEIRARKGRVFAIATEGDTEIGRIADDVFYIPETLEEFSPILSMAPLQLFAYYLGTQKGYNVDRPRNLAKSVTVE